MRIINRFRILLPFILIAILFSSCKNIESEKQKLVAEADKSKAEEQHDKACELYAKAYALDKNDAYLNLRLGFCKLTANQKDSALIYYTAAINIKPSEDGYIQRASCYLLMGKYAEVQTDAKAALALNAKSVKAVTLMGAANFKAGKFNEALVYFKQGIRLNADPTMPVNERTNTIDLYRNVARTHYDIKQLDSAEHYCNLWIKLDSNDFDAYQFMSIINEKNGKLEAAIANAEQTIKLQPQYIETYGHVAALYVLVKENNKACETANKAKANNIKGYEALIEAYCTAAK